ncbi:MAG: SulP family inorganic anion transporter, partial [Bacteroidota bacterium]
MPTTGMTTWEGIRKNFAGDFGAALYVSLLALPLSLAIAQGSGFPPIAGLIAAVVGGLVVPAFRGANLGINGPAAALMVIVLAGVEGMGAGDPELGYQRTLGAIVMAGLLVVIFGYLKLSRVAEFFPTPVIEGLMAAIGAIILIKQFHPLLGVKENTDSVLASAMHIPQSIATLEPHAALIGGISV